MSSRLPKDTDSNLVKILDKMVSRIPGDRYQTYEEVYSAMSEFYGKLANGQ